MGAFVICLIIIFAFLFCNKKQKSKYQKEKTGNIDNSLEKNKEEKSIENSIIANFPEEKSASSVPEYKKCAQDYIKMLEKEKEKRTLENAQYGTVYIGIEATSYDWQYVARNEILQIAIVDDAENILISQFCKPVKKKSWARASSLNSIYPFTVEDCPSFEDIKPYVQDIFNRSKKIVGFDYYLVRDFLEKYKFDKVPPLVSPVASLRSYNSAVGITNPKWTTLEDAACEAGVVCGDYDAVEDAKATLAICNFLKAKKKTANTAYWH